LQRLFEAGLIVGGCVALLAVVGAPFAIRVVGGSKFDASIAVLQTLGIGIPATYLVATWSFALLSLRRYRALMACNAIALTTALLLSALLIPAYGARGAGVVTASLELLLAGAYGVALSRIDSKLRPSLHLLPRIAISAGLGLAAGLALPVPSIVAAAAACGIYLSLLFQLRAFPAEVWLALRGRA
jgi:O-antigen/teichoic acid export membrane protein